MTVHGDVISHVNISHVMVEDGGEYTCTAENRAGKTTHSARLNVYGISILILLYDYDIVYIYTNQIASDIVEIFLLLFLLPMTGKGSFSKPSRFRMSD